MNTNENQDHAHVHARADDQLDKDSARAVKRARMSELAENKVIRGIGTAVTVASFIGGLIALGGATMAGVSKLRNRNNGGNAMAGNSDQS